MARVGQKSVGRRPCMTYWWPQLLALAVNGSGTRTVTRKGYNVSYHHRVYTRAGACLRLSFRAVSFMSAQHLRGDRLSRWLNELLERSDSAHPQIMLS